MITDLKTARFTASSTGEAARILTNSFLYLPTSRPWILVD